MHAIAESQKVQRTDLHAFLSPVMSEKRLSLCDKSGLAIFVRWDKVASSGVYEGVEVEIRKGVPIWKPLHLMPSVESVKLKFEPSSILVADTSVVLEKLCSMRVAIASELVRFQSIYALCKTESHASCDEASGVLCFVREKGHAVQQSGNNSLKTCSRCTLSMHDNCMSSLCANVSTVRSATKDALPLSRLKLPKPLEAFGAFGHLCSLCDSRDAR